MSHLFACEASPIKILSGDDINIVAGAANTAAQPRQLMIMIIISIGSLIGAPLWIVEPARQKYRYDGWWPQWATVSALLSLLPLLDTDCCSHRQLWISLSRPSRGQTTVTTPHTRPNMLRSLSALLHPVQPDQATVSGGLLLIIAMIWDQWAPLLPTSQATAAWSRQSVPYDSCDSWHSLSLSSCCQLSILYAAANGQTQHLQHHFASISNQASQSERWDSIRPHTAEGSRRFYEGL